MFGLLGAVTLLNQWSGALLRKTVAGVSGALLPSPDAHPVAPMHAPLVCPRSAQRRLRDPFPRPYPYHATQNEALQGQWFAHCTPPFVEVEEVLDDLTLRPSIRAAPSSEGEGDGVGPAAPPHPGPRRLSMLRCCSCHYVEEPACGNVPHLALHHPDGWKPAVLPVNPSSSGSMQLEMLVRVYARCKKKSSWPMCVPPPTVHPP